MYISESGVKIISPINKLLDTIKVNLDLDINDVPFTNLGIVRNFSKNNYSDTISFIRLQISDLLKANNYSNSVSIGDITYDEVNNLFTINLLVSEKEYKLSMNGG